ncbi:MAG: leucine--tRNA ligase, partial [Phycisphaerae bacterium]|nr:leucine--tRNA ligase [Phycisphaerae bacterium]
VRRPLRQWMFRITAFADRLLEDLEDLDWPQSTLRMQQEWIGRSEGADVYFSLTESDDSILVYTTRPDTLFGVTFMVLAPEHPLVVDILDHPPNGVEVETVRAYVDEAKNKSDVDRMVDQKEKTGVFTGIYAVNPASGEKIPVWIADYVLMGYGHGAIMAVPAHDQRDFDFATTFDIPIREVVSPQQNEDAICFSGNGVAINSSSEIVSIDGQKTEEAKQTIIAWLEESSTGSAKVNYRLRDWLFSRQRYWGEPFPVVFDEDGLYYPVGENTLPVVLPNLDDYTPAESDDPQPLLAKAREWLHTTAGEAGVDPALLDQNTPVTRESNTMPGWAGSCWYEIRFCSPNEHTRFVNAKAEKYWMGNGIDLYIGGAEHAVLHLLYARFWHKLLYDLGEVTCKEPFQKLFHQGLLTSFSYQRSNKTLVPSNMVKEQDEKFYEIETGEEVERVIAKMSKSLRNVVNPDDVIAEYGADTLRLYEMYMGPLEASAPWNTRDIVGVHRFLQRVWRLGIDDATGDVHYSLGQEPNAEVERALHATIAKVTDDIPKLAYNTAIASMIEFVNSSTSANALTTGQLDQFLRILSPFAPHIAQEMYSRIGGEGYISTQRWPIFNPSLLVDSVIEMPVQIMGKVRGRITVPADANPKEVEELALNNEHIALLLENVTVRKVIVIQNKIINIVAN